MAEEKTAEEIWAGVLTCLSNELEHSKFESWIRPITPEDVCDSNKRYSQQRLGERTFFIHDMQSSEGYNKTQL